MQVKTTFKLHTRSLAPSRAVQNETVARKGQQKKAAWVNSATEGTLAKAGKTASAQHIAPVISNARLDGEPIRTFERTDKLIAQIALDKIVGAPMLKARKFKPVDDAAFQRTLQQAQTEREHGLVRGGRAARAAPVLPEDTSLQVTAFHMADLGGDVTAGRLVPQMARIGQHEGFSVVLRVDEAMVKSTRQEMKDAGLDNVQVVGFKAEGEDHWSEDQGSIDRAGGISVPAFFHSKKKGVPDFNNAAAVYEDRLRRWYPEARVDTAKMKWAELISDAGFLKKFPDVTALLTVGAVGERSSQRAVAALAAASDAPLRIDTSHVEGGNFLSGTLPSGETYGLVGRDSVAVTRKLMERDTGQKFDERQTLDAIADDLGLKSKNIHLVEQPGDFHVDMGMAVFAPGQVVLNDAHQAFALQERWLRDDYAASRPRPLSPGADAKQRARQQQKLKEWTEAGTKLESQLKSMKARAQMVARFETRSAADLKAAGMEVHRMAGAFMNPQQPHKYLMNFFNGEASTNAKGERFFITNGGDPRAEKLVIASLLSKIPTGLKRVHFLDRELSQKSLEDLGGINCRVRAEGVVVKGLPNAS